MKNAALALLLMVGDCSGSSVRLKLMKVFKWADRSEQQQAERERKGQQKERKEQRSREQRKQKHAKFVPLED